MRVGREPKKQGVEVDEAAQELTSAAALGAASVAVPGGMVAAAAGGDAAQELNEAVEQVARAVQRSRAGRVSLGADIASSAVLLGIVVGFTVLLVLPVALVLGFLL